MGKEFASDDLARLLALEHAFYAMTLISAGNFSYLANTTTSDAVKRFRQATEGAFLDTKEIPIELNTLMRNHVRRMFDHVQKMAETADFGIENS